MPSEEPRHPNAQEPVDEEFKLVYGQLRRLAAWYLSGERPNHTLQPTALIHEAYLKLAASQDVSFRNREHFMALAAQAMRRILVDHARRLRAEKRGGGQQPIELGHVLVVHGDQEIIDLDRALTRLAEVDPRASRIMELSVFGGMSAAQIAEIFQLSDRMVRYEVAHARAWVLDSMGHSQDGGLSSA
jgi:RNA polymerase sigma-70 factor (ECF subfamily)